MKIKLDDYFVVGGFGQKSVFIKKDYTLPYYVSKRDVETKGTGFSIPAGMTFVVTVIIRSIDSKNLQANPMLLLIGFILVYLSVEWMVRKYAEDNHEVNAYHFPDDLAFLAFIKESQKRNSVMLVILLILGFLAILFGGLYISTNDFIFLLFSVLAFFCFSLWSKYKIFKRLYVLHKIKKELIR